MPKKVKADPQEDIEDDDLDTGEDTEPESKSAPEEPATSSEGDGGEGAPSPPEPPPPFWSKLGQEYADLDEETAATKLQERLRAAEETQQRERYFAFQAQQYQQQLAQREQQIQQWQQQQAYAAQQQQQAATAWKAPEYDPRWLSSVKRDEQGNLVPLHSGIDPTLPAKIQAYAEWKAENEKSFWQNPGDFVWQQVQPQVSQYLQQNIQQAIAHDRAMREVQDWEQTHRHILFDQNNQPTVVGRRIAQQAQMLGGDSPNRQAWDSALKIVHGELVIQQAQQADPNKVNQTKKMDVLKQGATQTRNRDGTFKRPETRRAPNPKLDIEDRMKQAFAEAGYDENHVFADKN